MIEHLVSARRYTRRQAMRLKVWWHWRGGDPARTRPDGSIPFLCNLCGAPNEGTLAALSREAPTCTRCGSNVRFRAMGYLVTSRCSTSWFTPARSRCCGD